MKSTLAAFSLLFYLLLPFAAAQGGRPRPRPRRPACVARYRVTVYNTATRAAFPAIRERLHFSPLVAFTHRWRFTSFVLFGYATPGVRSVAETGATGTLMGELRRARRASLVRDAAVRPRLLYAPGSFSVVVAASCDAPYVSFITMVAPSPDWFVGKARVLVRRKGKFLRRVAGPLRVYDAGTDAGKRLSSPNKRSDPVQNIAPLWGMPFRGRPVGRFVIQKL